MMAGSQQAGIGMAGTGEFSQETLNDLARYGFSDPYDPRFIWMSVFGNRMRRHRQRWPDIDFGELRSVNRDVAGWIHMDGTPVNYPIVRGHLDRDHYLGHNFSGEPSCHGQVQLRFGYDAAIGTRRNTPLLAHTMSDWSMFRAIRNLCSQAYLNEHPTVEILTPESRLVGRWFAAARYDSADPWPETVRFPDGDFESWLSRVLEGNWLRADLPAQPGGDSRILTCSMCAKSSGEHDMRALFAVLSACDR